MIRIVLLGRTGNNLFQYAMGRVLAQKHGVPLMLEASGFNEEGWREVSHFLRLPIQATVVRRCSLGVRALRKLTGKHYWEFTKRPIIREATGDHSFDTRHLEAPADCVLFGYFQSHLYFESIAHELRQEFTGLLGKSIHCPEPLSSRLSSANSVAVHVRRGDYLTHPLFQACDTAYYDKAMDAMRARLGSPRFYIFSDDPEWCRSAFTSVDTEVIDSGMDAANPLHDLYLMSLASHHIIANSSYSWWAAWIGKKPGQQVILPDRWFQQGIHAPMDEKNAWQASAT